MSNDVDKIFLNSISATFPSIHSTAKTMEDFMKKCHWLRLCIALIAIVLIAACDGTRMEMSDPKIGKATVLEKQFIRGDTGVSMRIGGGGPGTLGFGTGGVGIGIGGGLQIDLDPDPDRFVIVMSFNDQTVKKNIVKKKFDEIKPGTVLEVTYREKRWIKDGQVIRTEHWVEKIN